MPSASQAPYATILSNHGSFGGLTIEQEGAESNRYQVAIGTGSAYQKLADISLLPARLHYLAIELQPGTGEVYLDGQLESRQTIPAAIGDSGLPLRLGNWAGGGRSFSGRIDELLIAPELRSSAEIQARAAGLGVSR